MRTHVSLSKYIGDFRLLTIPGNEKKETGESPGSRPSPPHHDLHHCGILLHDGIDDRARNKNMTDKSHLPGRDV